MKWIKTKDFFEDFSKEKDLFDFSNYSLKWKYYDDSNKFVVGKMKDEITDLVLKKFAGLKQ